MKIGIPPKRKWFIHERFSRIGTLVECDRICSLHISIDKRSGGIIIQDYMERGFVRYVGKYVQEEESELVGGTEQEKEADRLVFGRTCMQERRNYTKEE